MMLYMCMLFVTVWMCGLQLRVGQEHVVLIFARCWCKFVRGRCICYYAVAVNVTAIRLHGIRERYIFFFFSFSTIFCIKSYLRAFRWHCESSFTLLKTNLFGNIVQQRNSVVLALHFTNQTKAVRERCCYICLNNKFSRILKCYHVLLNQ